MSCEVIGIISIALIIATLGLLAVMARLNEEER